MSALWVCAACGRESTTRDEFRDASCRTHAVEVIPSSVVRDERGAIIKATALVEMHCVSVTALTSEAEET